MSELQAAAALLDTSVLIAGETGRERGPLPARAAISVVTLAELRLGVMLAPDPQTHARRLRTLSDTERLFEALPITVDVAAAFAEIVGAARRRGQRPGAMDAWIAATAAANELTLYTQDSDFDGLEGVSVVRI